MKIKTIIITNIVASIFFMSCVNGSTVKETNVSNNNIEKTSVVENKTEAVASVDHTAFDKLLKANVSAKGYVNYANFVKNKTALQGYLKSLSAIKVSNLSNNEKLAFWINAYNAATIDQIIRNYPVSSILKIANGKVWDQTLAYKFDNRSVTLNDIEKKILLGTELFDARVHFAVNCAAVSCPTLSNTAYSANNVQDMLTANTKAALSDPKFNKITTSSASLSKLFDWYKADFIKAEGSVVDFVNKYSTTKVTKNTKINYLEYNWDLNGK
ncbi:DUF547 domain-containing protein [Pedobacter alpinus]|uniref:DUF547 domain-containing protein n=1 Tax=Pedobacter alpinus TaxID=1590643 RepID=A0ABW5TU57_9SPHI